MPLHTHIIVDNAQEQVTNLKGVIDNEPSAGRSTTFHHDTDSNSVLIRRRDSQGFVVTHVQVPLRHLEVFMAERIRQVRTTRLEEASDTELLYGTGVGT